MSPTSRHCKTATLIPPHTDHPIRSCRLNKCNFSAAWLQVSQPMLSQAGDVLPERHWPYPGAEMDPNNTSNPTEQNDMQTHRHRADHVSCQPVHQRPRVSVTRPVLTAQGAPPVMIRCSVVFFVSPSRQMHDGAPIVTASFQILFNSSSDVPQSTLRSRKTLRGTTQNAVTSRYFVIKHNIK